jgi:hypothetical protein
VATLADGARGPGRHAVEWRGVDDDGTTVAEGVYFLRLAAGGREARERLVLVR